VLAGVIFTLQLDTAISSEINKVEDPVEAHVTEAVLVGPHVAIPANARIIGSVTVAEKGGGLNKPSRIGVRFHTLVVGAQELVLDIDPLIHEVQGPGGDSKKTIGVGAGIGAAVGMFTGGIAGAVKGGVAGAGGGTAAAAMSNKAKFAEVAKGATAKVRLKAPITVVDK